MIVKTKTDDFGNNTIGLNNPFKGLFNGDFFKRQNLLSDADITAIKAYNTEIDKCVTSQTAFNRTMLNTSKEAQNIVAAANGGTVAINGLTKSSKAAELGMRALSMAGNMIASMVISWVVSEAISWLNDLAHAEENARKRSEELTSSYETEKQNIDDSISKYKELSEKLDNTSLSTSEVKSIKEQLLDIQDQLYEKYGEEATQIDLVNGKYDEQIEKLGILSKKKAGDYVAENYSDIKADEKYVTEDFNVNKVLQYGSTQFSSFDLQKYLEKYDTLGIKKYESKGQYGVDQIDLVSNGTRQEVYDQISNLLQDLNHDFGESNPEVNALKTTLSNILNDSFDTDELANANSRIKKYAEAEILSNDKASKSYNDLVDAVDNYNTALKTGNGVDEAKEKLIETKQAAEDSTKDITNSEKVLQDVYNSLSGEAPIEFQVEIGKNVDEEIKKSYDDAISSAKEKYSEDLTPFFEENSINTQEEIDRWNDVAANCDTATEAKKKYLETNVPDNEISVSTLSSAWEQLKASTDDATKGVADDLQALADKGELTIDTFRDTDGAENYFDNLGYSAEEAVKYINSLSDKNSQLGAMSKNIKSITDALGTKASDGLVSVDDLSGFDATIKGLSTWEKFSTLLGDASSSMEDCQKIANELATEYVNSESVLSNLNETNRAYYESQLDNMGVTNSAAVVEATLAKNLGEEKIATEEAVKAGLSLHGTKIDTTNATELFSNATAGEIIQLANEASQSGVSSQALALLAVKKLNNPTLTTDGDIKNLMDLCKGLDLATQAIKTFQSIKNSVMNPDGTFKATGTAGAQQSEALNNAFNAMKSLVKTSVGGASVNSHGSSGGGTSGGGGGGSSSTAKTAFDKLSDWASQFFDWIEVRLDRLQKKIDSNISKAESKLNDKRYSSATANYMSAVGNTYTKMYTEQKGRDKYLNTANSYLNKAISLGAINKKLAKEIKTRVADGSINISRYSSDIQTVISTYKDWIDKAKDCTTAMQTLHDSLRTYAEDLKKVSDTQRDATVSIAETKQTLASGGVQNTATAKNSSLGYNNSVLNTKNSAYYTAAKSANSNVNRFAKSATSALNKGKIKKNTKYNATLNSIKGYIKKRVAIPDSLLTIVAKKNATLYNRLYMYNLSIENLQTAREEYTTAFAVNNAEKYNNIADKYKNWDDATNDTMDMNSTKSSNAVSAKDKNSYLDKQKSGYGTIVTRDKNEQNEYNKARATAKSNMFKSAKGASYSSLSKTNRNTINKYINDARKSAKSGKIISVSTLAKLSEYYKKGYISSGFFNSCIDYNNALESYNQAKVQTEIDEQTQITQRAEIASQKFSNISTEYDNKRHQYDQTATELNNNMSILEERGNGASATWYSRLAKNEESSRSNLIQKRTDLVKELNNAVKNGDVAYKSEKWYEMRSQIDDVTNSIDEATKSLAEYNNQIMQVHWDRIDEQANKVQNLIDENNFIIDELSRRDLTSDDTGGLTSEGNAVAGLHISNYEAYKKNAETYYAEIESINKKLANDPYNQKLIDQKEKLVKSYQDCVKGAEDEKWATIDLMKSGYDALKNHISDLIDKFNDLLDSEKDAYDYANNISEKTKTLSDLRKQLVAISGDTSEETRAKAQELNQSLKDAEKDLKDTQYDKLISSTKDMLSDFQTDLDDSIQDVIKNLDDNFSQLINNIDSHWNNETITSLMEKIQYVATDSFNNVSADGKISESTGNVVSDIQSFMERAWAKYDRDAETTQQDKIDEATKEKVKNNILNNSNSGSSSGSSTDVKIDANKLISRIDNPTNKISPAYNNTTTNTNSTAPVGKVLSTSQKKWVNDFLKKNIVVAQQDVSKYGNLNKVLYRNWGKKILPTSKWTELAKKIGFSNFSSATNSAFYQTLHRSGIKGFKKGSDGIPYDMIANLGENGTELQYDISKGVLKSVGQGDMIFTAEQAKTLMEFAKNPMAYKNMYTGTAFSMPSVPANNKVDNDVNISIGDIKLEGVQDPKQLANGIKDVIKNNTGGVRSMIKEDTIGSLSKGYNSQSVKRW